MKTIKPAFQNMKLDEQRGELSPRVEIEITEVQHETLLD